MARQFAGKEGVDGKNLGSTETRWLAAGTGGRMELTMEEKTVKLTLRKGVFFRHGYCWWQW